MASIFTQIIEGNLPGRFVWKDDVCVTFLSINPLSPGHALVVPRVEVDHWIEADDDVWQHCCNVARKIGRGIDRAWSPARVGMVIAGYEIPHLHLHVFATDSLADFDFKRAAQNPDPAELDTAAEKLRGALQELGYEEVPDA